MKIKVASLISGGGTTMEAIGKACLSGEIPFDLVCVISSDPKAGGIGKAKNLGIAEADILVINPEDFRIDGKVDQEKFGQAIMTELKKRKVDVVLQNGWMPLTPKNVIDEYQGAIFNQHPGPVPEFGGRGMYGQRVHAAVLEFRKMTGRDFSTEAICQRVDPDFDMGAVVKSAQIEIRDDDTAESLAARVLPIEHRVQVELLKDLASGNVHEVTRPPIVLAGEEKILEAAKQKAIKLYPGG
ncbi:hypothetical protein HYW40_01690 [Candidatus Curtissbacteria bacterium]|nr:hypothetical protein [Candidatus Curtissbacteria bacterium]